jgi:NADP-dependent 3-hydroxy acid dehydrogenase YdfG
MISSQTLLLENRGRILASFGINSFSNALSPNLTGVWNFLKAQLAQIGEGGSVANAASIAGLQGITKSGPYVATKVSCQLSRSHNSLGISISNDCFSMV